MAFKIYTKTGDQGETGLFGGKRLPKHHLRIEAYGTIDELNSYVGLIRDLQKIGSSQIAVLQQVQERLFTAGSSLASDPDKQMVTPDLLESDITVLERAIDQMDEQLPALKNFILPGGHPDVAHCHIARCVCRRAERRVVALAMEEKVEEIIIRYLNRLSDYLFTLARKMSMDLEVAEIPWNARKKD